MKGRGLPFMAVMITALSVASRYASDMLSSFSPRKYGSTAKISSKHRQPKFRRTAKNGKWSMKCHRGRS